MISIGTACKIMSLYNHWHMRVYQPCVLLGSETKSCYVCLSSKIACLIRVPVEVVKQRAQAAPALSSIKIFKQTLAAEVLL